MRSEGTATRAIPSEPCAMTGGACAGVMSHGSSQPVTQPESVLPEGGQVKMDAASRGDNKGFFCRQVSHNVLECGAY